MSAPWYCWDFRNPCTRDEYFEIHYYPGYYEDAQKILDFAICARKKALDYLNMKFDKIVKIFIYIGPRTRGGYELKYNNMSYDNIRHHISMISPTISSGVDPQYEDTWYKANLIHEYIHAVTLEYVNERGKNIDCFMPKWFSEGIAEYIKLYHSSRKILDYYERYIKCKYKSIIDNKIDFNELSRNDLVRNRENHIGWAILIEYLIETASKDHVLDVFNSDKRCLIDALKEKIGEDFKEKWSYWLDSKREEFNC